MMKPHDQHKYGDGISKNDTQHSFKDKACCKGSPGFRTDYEDTMEPHRGARTYPSVIVVNGKTNRG